MEPDRVTLKLFFLSFEKVCKEIRDSGWIQRACLSTTLLKIFFVRQCRKERKLQPTPIIGKELMK